MCRALDTYRYNRKSEKSSGHYLQFDLPDKDLSMLEEAPFFVERLVTSIQLYQ
jgi:hypothetical protein